MQLNVDSTDVFVPFEFNLNFTKLVFDTVETFFTIQHKSESSIHPHHFSTSLGFVLTNLLEAIISKLFTVTGIVSC